MMSKQVNTKVAQGLDRIFVEFKCETTKSFGGMETSLTGFTLGAQRRIANFSAMPSKWLAIVREASPVPPSASASDTSAATTGPAPSTSAGQGCKGALQ